MATEHEQPLWLRIALWCLAGSTMLVALLLAALWLPPWGDDAPPPQAAGWPQAPRLVLVLGAGGPRGFAHVGVLKALEELNIQPDAVVGASAGAVAGALWLGGHNAKALETMAHELPWWHWIDLARDFSPRLRGQQFAHWAARQAGHSHIEQLPRPFAAVATERGSNGGPGRSVAFTRGSLALALQASSATPSMVAPVRIGGQWFEDGDQSSPVPVHASRALGARKVIAVDVSARLEATPASVPEAWRVGDRLMRQRVDAQTGAADVLIHVDLGYYAGASQAYREFAIARGHAAIMAQAEALRALARGD